MTPDIILPYQWEPRGYQKKAWNYWVRDEGKHAEIVWHRRSGKDDIALHGTCIKAHERVANYWHMLPLANQVRKAIWEAVNPRTGHRRIDEAFPEPLREATRDSDMLIRFKNGSTWQCLGSDNYQGAIGATPAGIVYSEWSQANPSSRGYLRPILMENEGWQVYITTPRGKNHAFKTFRSAQKSDSSFAELLTAEDTGVFTAEQLKSEKQEYIDTYGDAMGNALFLQEYYCSFDAAILGAIWGSELAALEQEGRLLTVPHDPDYKVFTVWDIGRTDATAIWFYQVIGNEVRIIDFCQETLKDPDYFASQIIGQTVTIDLVGDGIKVNYGEEIQGLEHRRAYEYQTHWLPHDAKQKTFAAKGKSVEQQLKKALGYGTIKPVPNLSVYDGIQLTRQLLRRCVVDYRCEEGIEAVKQYRYEWDDDKKKFRDKAVHDWTSHPADSLRYLSIVYKLEPSNRKVKIEKPDPYGMDDDDLDWKTG